MARARSARRRALLRNAAVVVSVLSSEHRPFRIRLFSNRDFGFTHFRSFQFARFFHAESSLEIPRKIETHNLLNLNRGNCPSRSEADPRGQSKARKRGDIADVRWGRRTPRAAPFRGISAHAFTPPPKPTIIKMACMSLSMKVAVAASECPRARSSLSATAREVPRRVERAPWAFAVRAPREARGRERRVRTPRTRDPKADLSPRRPSPLPPAEPVTKKVQARKAGASSSRDFRERSRRAWIPDREGPTGETRARRTPRARVGDGVACLAAPIAPHDLPSARAPAWPPHGALDRPPRGRLSNRPRRHLLAHAPPQEEPERNFRSRRSLSRR